MACMPLFPAAPPAFRLYAEVLRNIRSATLVAVLEENTVIDKAVVIGEGLSVELTINGGSVSVDLPAPMETIPRVIARQLRAVDEFTLRYTLETCHTSADPPGERGVASHASDHDNVVPWNAGRMEELGRTVVRGSAVCRECQKPFLRLEAMRAWKDLPREGWEESLDLWHCHRPHEKDCDKRGAIQIDGKQGAATGDVTMKDDDTNRSGDDHEEHDTGPSGNHPATNRVQIARGYGHAGLLYWLVDAADCTNVQVRPLSITPPLLIPQPPQGAKKEAFAGARLQTPWQCLRYKHPRSMQVSFERGCLSRLHVPRLRGPGFAWGLLRTKCRRRVVLAATP
jgi:hypothetical protein